MFDKVIMNPPYLRSLHLKILSTVINNCPTSEIVSLQPDFTRPINSHIKDFKLKQSLSLFLSERPTYIPNTVANELFNISSYDNLMIGKFSSEGGYKVEPTKVFLLNEKMERTGVPLKSYYGKQKTEWKLPLVKLFLQSNTERKPPFISDNGIVAKSGWTKGIEDKWTWAYFSSEEEMNNFRKLFTDTFYGAWVPYLRPGRQIANIHIPDDYTHPWTDKDLYEYFGLTDEEIEVIECSVKS